MGKEFWVGSSPKTQSPWAKSERGLADFTNTYIRGLFGGTNAAFDADPLQNQAAQGLTQFNPMSYLTGSYGGFGGRESSPMGMLSRAGSIGMGDQYGGLSGLQGLMGRLGGDVSSSPDFQAAVASATDAGQRLFNQNAGQIQGAAQRASGGVGAGSSGVQQLARALSDTSAQIGSQVGGLALGELGRRQSLQGSIGQFLGGMPLQQAGLLASLAGTGGNLMNQAGQLQLSGLGQLAGLGNTMWGQNMMGYQYPLQQALSFLTAGRGAQSQGQESGLASLLKAGGSAFSGAASMVPLIA